MNPTDRTDKESIEAGRKLLGLFDDMGEEHYVNGHARQPAAAVTTADRVDRNDGYHANRPNSIESKDNVAQKRFGAGVLIVFALAAVFAVESYALRQPNFSSTTTTYLVKKGDGIGAAADHVQGIDKVDSRDVVDYIKAMPQNTETLKDGLQPGETLVTPESVTR